MPGRVDLVELLHGEVVVAVHEAAGDVLVQRVGEHRVADLGVGRVTADQLVPPRLGVEHRRPQLATRRDPDRAQRLVGHPRRHVAELADTQRVGQTAGRVDGQHEDPAALLGRRRQAEGGGHASSCRPRRSRTRGPSPCSPATPRARSAGSSPVAAVGRSRARPSRHVQLVAERLGDEGDDATPGRPGEQLGHVEDRQAGRRRRRAGARGAGRRRPGGPR